MQPFFHHPHKLTPATITRPKCLLVDDRDDNLLSLEALLRDEAADLYKARTGDEALELMLKNEFAVALVDVQMPGMDGFELAELLRGAQRTRHVPLIFVTAAGRERTRVFRGYESGAVDFLFKPLDPFVVQCKVRVFLELDSQRRRLHTELQRAERALFEAEAARGALIQSEQRYRVMGDTIPYGVWMCKPDGQIEYVSASLCDLIGASLETLQRNGAAHYLHPDDGPAACARWRRCLETCEAWDSELRLRARDGTYRAVLSRGLPVYDRAGRTTCWVGVNLDIAARKAMEEELRSAHDLRAQLLSVVSHDLRNPLNTIHVGAQLLAQGIRRGNPDEHLVQRVQNAAMRMAGIIDQLFDFSRARQADGFPIALGPCDLRRLCDAIVTELRIAHPRVIATVDGPSVLEGLWDTRALGQVFSNLVGNAIQHGNGEPIEVRLREGPDHVRVEVHNWGNPIPTNLLPHIFDAFRGGSAAQSHSHHLGLGLFVARRIVEAHGGSVDVASTERDGTCFTVTLPRPTSGLGSPRSPSHGGDL